MQRLSSKYHRAVLSSLSNLFSRKPSPSPYHTLSGHLLTAPRNVGFLRQGGIKRELANWDSFDSVRNFSFASGFTPLQPKPIGSIMDMERAKTKSPEELASIWDDFHLGRGHIGISMNTKLYRLFEQRASDCRYFVIPVWRGKGYISMFVQVQTPHILFTGLEDYKARGTQAAPYLTATFYTEFSETKDLVLIRGDIVFTSKLTDEEAKWVMETTQTFYLNDTRFKLVERFNKQTRDFEFKDVLQALEMPNL